MIGRTIGKYRIVEQIGRGGMGTVYKAVDETLDRLVAVKMINADLMTAERMQRFRSEAVALARLNHPRIATIHELTRDGDDLLMVMEYVAGETCERLVARNGALPVAQAVMICDQVLDALEHAHSAGIVHRDLKPANLMVRPAGDVKVMDFGIARIAGSQHLTSDGYMMGTPAYMSPEQVRGSEVDSRMDLYAVAVVLYRLLTNHLPFRADTPMAIIQSHLMDQPTPARQLRPDLPPWIDEILERGLAKSPDDRVQTAAEFRFALQRGLSGTSATMAAPWLDRSSAETFGVPTPAGLWPSPSRSMPIPGGMPTPSAPSRVATSAVPTALIATSPLPTGSNPAPTAATRTDSTLTLRTPHLALAATLFGLLVIGIAVLAYAALRRPSPVTTTQPVAAQAPAAAVTPTPAPEPAAAAAAPPVPGSPPAATSPVPSSVPGAATAPVPAANVARGAPAPGAPPASMPNSPRGAAGAGTAAPAGSTSRGGERATKAGATPSATSAATAAKDAAASASAAPAPAPAPAPPPAPVAVAEPVLPPAATAPTESFGDVKAVVPGEGSKSRDLDALLSLEPGKLVVRSRDSGAVLKTLPYQAIAAVTYVQSKRPKASDSSAVAPVPENVAGSGFFLGTAKHWLTLQSVSDFLILRLDDKNVRAITMSLEARTGVKTQRPDQAK